MRVASHRATERSQALRARARRHGLPIVRGERSSSAIAPNLLDRQFLASAPNQKRVAGFTYLWTAEGWLYVTVVLDLYSRRVVGWLMQPQLTTQLVTDALMMAVWQRGQRNSIWRTQPQCCFSVAPVLQTAPIALKRSVRWSAKLI